MPDANAVWGCRQPNTGVGGRRQAGKSKKKKKKRAGWDSDSPNHAVLTDIQQPSNLTIEAIRMACPVCTTTTTTKGKNNEKEEETCSHHPAFVRPIIRPS